MADKSKISWTDATWNFLRGCKIVSEECINCYAMNLAARFSGPNQPYENLACFVGQSGEKHAKWTGELKVVENVLDQPLKWKKPRLIFVNSVSDLFYEKVEVSLIKRSLEIMQKADWHIFQVLTKRSKRMLEVMSEMVLSNGRNLAKDPLENVWLGVSVGLEKTVFRIDDLKDTPAFIRFVSAEPLIGEVNWKNALKDKKCNWLILGGESQENCRPCKEEWIIAGIEACNEYGIAPYVKQMGTLWAKENKCNTYAGTNINNWPVAVRVQKYPIDLDKWSKK